MNSDYSRLFAAHPSTVQTQTHDAAAEKRIAALDIQFTDDLDFARLPYEGTSRVRPVENLVRPSGAIVDERRAFGA